MYKSGMVLSMCTSADELNYVFATVQNQQER